MKAFRSFHALRSDEISWGEAGVSPEWSVAYPYCEENNLMSTLLSAQQDGRLDAFYATLPLTRGEHSIACGDWMARIWEK